MPGLSSHVADKDYVSYFASHQADNSRTVTVVWGAIVHIADMIKDYLFRDYSNEYPRRKFGKGRNGALDKAVYG